MARGTSEVWKLQAGVSDFAFCVYVSMCVVRRHRGLQNQGVEKHEGMLAGPAVCGNTLSTLTVSAQSISFAPMFVSILL